MQYSGAILLISTSKFFMLRLKITTPDFSIDLDSGDPK